jgi:hypothetical protein
MTELFAGCPSVDPKDDLFGQVLPLRSLADSMGWLRGGRKES